MAERGKIFKEAPIIAPHRSWFDMSYENTFSMNIGENVPAAIYECLPGDVIKAKTDSLTRFSPLLAPVMTSVNQFSYHFYVRMRDIWTNFDKFITNNDQKRTWQANVSSFVAPEMPYFKPRNLLYDAFGCSSAQDCSPYNAEVDGELQYTVGGVTDVTYKLFLIVRKQPNSDGYRTWYAFIDKARYDSIDVSGMLAYNQVICIHFKPNPNEFDYDYDTGSSYRDYVRMNPFGNGSLMDFLGVDVNPMFADQWRYFNQAAYTLLINGQKCHNLETIKSWIDNENDSIFTNYPIPDSSRSTVETPLITEFSGDIENFINNHCIISIDYHTIESSVQYGIATTARGTYRSYSGSSTPTVSTITEDFGGIAEDPLCALPLRAYRFIYDEYFRDENYIQVNPLTDFSRDGNEFGTLDENSSLVEKRQAMEYLMLTRKAWEHDPYTTALPGPQRGEAVHYLPANVRFTQDVNVTDTIASGTTLYPLNIDDSTNNVYPAAGNTLTGNINRHPVYADLSAATIENFRWANSMQKYLEKKARTGGRYYEYLLGIWNKSVDDSKLNRPIYLSGDRTPIQVSEVLQTSESNVKTHQALGDMAGRAIALGNDDYIEYEAPDYGYFIELTCVLPRVAYQSGVSSIFCKENYLDFPLPDFAQLGEEYVKRKELYYTCKSDDDNRAFGYQSRYWQYKYRRSEIHGDMKDSLDFWHFGRKFESAPVNGKEFIECNPDYRQFAVTDKGYSHVYCQMWHDVQMNRALPEYGVPVL